MKHTLTLSEQPAEPRSLLERNILTWAVVVQNITPRLSGKELVKQMAAIAFKRERAPEEWLIDAHLLVIGVRQIEEHLQYLKQVGFRTLQIKLAAKQFSAACRTADMKNLRDLLEHQAQYIAGKPKKPHLVVDPKQLVSFGDDAPGKEQAVWVSVFGKKCRVDRIVRAVAALEPALLEWRRPLQESEDPTKTVTFGFPGTPLTFTFTEEHARLVLAELLAHEENSDAQKIAVGLFQQALQQRERR